MEDEWNVFIKQEDLEIKMDPLFISYKNGNFVNVHLSLWIFILNFSIRDFYIIGNTANES